MEVSILSAGQFHYRLPANSLIRRGHHVTFYTSSPRRWLRGYAPEVKLRYTPAPLSILSKLTRMPISVTGGERQAVFTDWLCARMLRRPVDLALCAATGCLTTLQATHKLGAVAVVDRACPYVLVQQDLLAEEARKVGSTFERHSPWYVERQIAEYEEADLILSPSNYSRQSFPERLQKKIALVPLFGRVNLAPLEPQAPNATFTVGVVGGQPLRKGYLYLLEAWKKLALPNARLLIRSGTLSGYPLLEKLAASLPNVELVPYVPDISSFYRSCDAFILPSIDDGFGMALFEAMAHGVPSIATRNTGATELLTDGKDMLLIDAGSSDQIADALTRLYESPELREQIGLGGRRTIEGFQNADGTSKPHEEGMNRFLSAVETLRSKSFASSTPAVQPVA